MVETAINAKFCLQDIVLYRKLSSECEIKDFYYQVIQSLQRTCIPMQLKDPCYERLAMNITSCNVSKYCRCLKQYSDIRTYIYILYESIVLVIVVLCTQEWARVT